MAQSLIDALVSKQILDLAQASEINQEAGTSGEAVEEILYRRGVSQGDVAEAKSALSGYPVKRLEGSEVAFETLREIPEDSAKFYRMIPLGTRDGYFDVGMLDPENGSALEALKFITSRLGLPARIFIITPSDLETVLRQYQSLSGEVTKALGRFTQEVSSGIEDVKISEQERLGKITEEAPVTKMFAVTLRHAVEGKASDIHIEPGKDRLRVRFRVDGVLHTSLTLPMDVHPALATRVKVLTNLKIDETRVPQDGRFHAVIMDRDIDFRVSTLPTAFGEKVVIRILDPQISVVGLEDLGLEGRNLAVVQKSIERPYGMILITGPTGSGKSTTLYALLKILNDEKVNIVSLEDPIEYYMGGVNQSQVKPEIQYDFATGLRHVVRQDPDIIMVGEIRDKETA